MNPHRHYSHPTPTSAGGSGRTLGDKPLNYNRNTLGLHSYSVPRDVYSPPLTPVATGAGKLYSTLAPSPELMSKNFNSPLLIPATAPPGGHHGLMAIAGHQTEAYNPAPSEFYSLFHTTNYLPSGSSAPMPSLNSSLNASYPGFGSGSGGYGSYSYGGYDSPEMQMLRNARSTGNTSSSTYLHETARALASLSDLRAGPTVPYSSSPSVPVLGSPVAGAVFYADPMASVGGNRYYGSNAPSSSLYQQQQKSMKTMDIFESPSSSTSPDGSSPNHSRSGSDQQQQFVDGQSRFVCNFKTCMKTFDKLAQLRSHTKTHSVEKPFVCDSCTMRFSRNHDLKRHQRIHSGARPYVCDNCEKSFIRLDALSRHLKVNNGRGCKARPKRTEPKCDILSGIHHNFSSE
eukprot:Partr_v1_DN24198_c0_g1_i1_m70970 putative Zinc finger protein